MIAKIWFLLGPFYLSLFFIFTSSLHPFSRKIQLKKLALFVVFSAAVALSTLSWANYLSKLDKLYQASGRPYEIKLRDEDGLRFEFLRQTPFERSDKVALIGADSAHDLHFSRFWIYPAEVLVGKDEIAHANKVIILGGEKIKGPCNAILIAQGVGGRIYRIDIDLLRARLDKGECLI